jgi:hypothetical protein
MTPEEKRLKITTPIPLERVLSIYGVSSEAELMSLLKDKFETYGKNFLSNKKKKGFNFFRFFKKTKE